MATLRKNGPAYENGNKRAQVYRDSEWQEYRTKFYVDGQHQINADYHGDKQDCHDTAQAWIK